MQGIPCWFVSWLWAHRLPGLSKRFRVAGDAKKSKGRPHKTRNASNPDHCLDHSHLVFHRQSPWLSLLYIHDLRDDIICKSTKFHDNLQNWIWRAISLIFSIVTHSNLIHFKLRFYSFLSLSSFLNVYCSVLILSVSCSFIAKKWAKSILSSRRIFQSSRWNAPVAGLYWQPWALH